MVFGGILIFLGAIAILLTIVINEFIPALLTLILGFGCFIFGLYIIGNKEESLQNIEYKYPKSEYNLEYEIVSRGEQTDTIYVISKINK